VLLLAAAAWLGLLLLVAVLVPYHGTDALVYGTWSERIADLGTLRTPGAGNALLHRPLFYGGQGALWWLFGIHEWIGRLWSYAFMVVLAWAVYRVAGGGRRDALAGALALALLLAIPDVAVQAAAGQTDVPVAALVTLSAALVWTVAPTPWRTAGLVAAVAAAALTKPSAFPALFGLALATLVGSPRDLRSRVLRDTLPIAGGVALALVYHLIQSRYLGQSLYDFVAGATEDPRAVAAVNVAVADTYAEARRTIVVAAQWIGPYVALLALYAVLYAVARVAGLAHRRAAPLAAPVAVVLSWLLPYLGQAGERTVRVGPLEAGQPGATVAFALLLGVLWLFARSRPDRAPDRTLLGRMLVWALPMVAAWVHLNPSETRYLSAAWAPLAALMAVVLAGAVREAARRGPAAAIAVAVLPLLLVALNLRNLDGLGTRPDGTYNAARALADFRFSDLGHPERMRALADPQLAGLLDGARQAAGPDGRLLTNDGRMIFFFVDRVTVRGPQDCADTRGYDAVGLFGNPSVPIVDLRGCPGLELLREVPDSYAVYRAR